MTVRHETSDETYDAIVIGAGPAGSTAAMALADAGRSVLVLERRGLPRFHIGESQLTYTAELLRQLGLYEEAVQQGYPIKTGAEFIFPNGDFRRTDFADQGPGRQPTTFQVERAHFDEFLARSAARRGARLVENAMVHDLLYNDEGRLTGVRYELEKQSHVARAKWVIDAGGRASKIAHDFNTRQEISWLRNLAVFRHYTGLDERNNPGHEGDIQIGGHRDGWLWAIPIWPDTISIGAVMPRSVFKAGAGRDAVLDEHLSRCPRILERLRGTTPGSETRVESDYCYYSDMVTGSGWLMAGDAGTFIDPIFSGGTCLAVTTGREAGRTVDRMLDAPERTEELRAKYASLYKTGYDSYTRLISAYYESEYKLGAYLIQRGFSVEGDRWFARMLSGDFWSDLNPVNTWLREQRRWDTFAPFEPLHTCPVYPELDAAERAERAGTSRARDSAPV
jgi:FADH2-dependent halogenase